jgi:hypothetical protein
MKKNQYLIFLFKILCLAFITLSFLTRCSQDEEILETTVPAEENITASAQSTTCNCTYIIPPNKNTIDGKVLNIKPGAVLCLEAATKYGNLQFKNIIGTSSQPITIKNCGGTVNIVATGLSYGVKFSNSKYFRFTGGSIAKTYGIKINGGHIGMSLEYLSTNFEVDHVEVGNSGFAGIMAKTDPTCDDATIRGNFVMTNVKLHDNYVYNTGGEGFYVGNSFYKSGRNTSCGVRYPHEIHNLKLFNNVVKNSGWEGIQVGCATRGAMIYGNSVENYGTQNATSQNNGVQLGEGTGGVFYNNYIKDGKGNGLIVLGLGDNLIHNNVIVNAGASGIFCDDRVTTGTGFKFINNTIVNPKVDGLRIYADVSTLSNIAINNIFVNPGSYSTYTYPRTGNDAYIYKLSSKVKLLVSNNYQTRSISAVKFANAASYNYKLVGGSPAINKGKNISTYNISKDFYNQTRLKGSYYDIGASEY